MRLRPFFIDFFYVLTAEWVRPNVDAADAKLPIQWRQAEPWGDDRE
jgi:hypothetical protein